MDIKHPSTTKEHFKIADDGIDPDLVPYKVLYTGAKMPGIGLVPSDLTGTAAKTSRLL